MWTVILTDEVEEWFVTLARTDAEQAARVEAAIDTLADEGPLLGRPLADRIKGSELHHLKELRPLATHIRILFAFDPDRQAILLVAGDKAGQWKQWYIDNIPLAEKRYQRWLDAKDSEDDGT